MYSQLKPLFLATTLAALLTACSSINLNPFSSGSKENPRTPQDAVTYVCEGNKQFHVRMLNNGNEAWLIYPDHEVSLPKSSGGTGRYSSGTILLVINGEETTLNDGEKIAYTACKAQAKK